MFILLTCCSSGSVPERTALQLGGQDRPLLNSAVLSGTPPNFYCSVSSLANPMNVYIYGNSYTEPCTSYPAQTAAPAVRKFARSVIIPPYCLELPLDLILSHSQGA